MVGGQGTHNDEQNVYFQQGSDTSTHSEDDEDASSDDQDDSRVGENTLHRQL